MHTLKITVPSSISQGNFSVIKSPDEYTVIIDTQRGPKDFQFDQIFVPEHGQERVFEDTNVSKQSFSVTDHVDWD